MIVAVEFQSFGGILSLLVLWFGALVGPTSVPMILGLMPAFRHSGATAAIVSWAGGIATLGFVKYGLKAGMGTHGRRAGAGVVAAVHRHRLVIEG